MHVFESAGRFGRRRFRRAAIAPGCALICALTVIGCVERTVTIRTEPEGAAVLLNDQDVGRSPVTVPFTWYGDYDIVARKAGYETLKTSYHVQAPWYQIPGIDIFAECFVPFTIYDHHESPILKLEPRPVSTPEDVIARAEEMRERALFKAE